MKITIFFLFSFQKPLVEEPHPENHNEEPDEEESEAEVDPEPEVVEPEVVEEVKRKFNLIFETIVYLKK